MVDTSFQVTYIGKHGLSVQSANPRKDAFNWTVWATLAAAKTFDNLEGLADPAIGRIYHTDGSVTAYAQTMGASITFEPIGE